MLKGKGINAVVLLGILSLASILIVQMVWMRKTIAIQQTNIAIQEKEDSLNLKEFSESAHIALRNVLALVHRVKVFQQKGNSSKGSIRLFSINSRGKFKTMFKPRNIDCIENWVKPFNAFNCRIGKLSCAHFTRGEELMLCRGVHPACGFSNRFHEESFYHASVVPLTFTSRV